MSTSSFSTVNRCVELGEVEHVTDEPLEPVGLSGSPSRVAPAGRILDDAFAQCVRVAADRGQR
jgi:hypothetical protein